MAGSEATRVTALDWVVVAAEVVCFFVDGRVRVDAVPGVAGEDERVMA